VTKKTIKIDLQVLRNHAVVAGSAEVPESMLVLHDDANLFIDVLHPLTGHVINLPSVKTLQHGCGRGLCLQEVLLGTQGDVYLIYR
jgi:hypothetical protein